MSTQAQFIMAGLAFALAMTWTCLTIKEKSSLKSDTESEKSDGAKQSFWESLKDFFLLSPEVKKICTMQFFTWIGTMCMMIFFTQYAVHTIYFVPDLTTASEAAKEAYASATLAGTNFSSICFAIFNLICFVVAIPMISAIITPKTIIISTILNFPNIFFIFILLHQY